MAKKTPQPRPCFGFGYNGSIGHTFPDGTWIESEGWAYPHGGFSRRAYVNMPGGGKRVVRISLPDTFFSVPARAKIDWEWVQGFISVDEGGSGVSFTRNKTQKKRNSV